MRILRLGFICCCTGLILPAQAADAPPTVPQSIWASDGTRPLIERMKTHTKGITSIVLHHTESPNQPPAMEKARLVGVQRFHIEDKSWGDIAYHYLIGPSGQIYEGRDVSFQGDSGTTYDLDGRLLVCMIGSFTEQLPEAVAMQSMVALVADQLNKHGLKPADVVTHRMVAATDCPGDALQAWFESEGRQAIAKAYAGNEEKATLTQDPAVPE
jgi:N-acetylmuramoyl-L-alanine amidase